nr:hypothetical protein Iba_chr01aCG4430 [Ipomoea batatas]
MVKFRAAEAARASTGDPLFLVDGRATPFHRWRTPATCELCISGVVRRRRRGLGKEEGSSRFECLLLHPTGMNALPVFRWHETATTPPLCSPRRLSRASSDVGDGVAGGSPSTALCSSPIDALVLLRERTAKQRRLSSSLFFSTATAAEDEGQREPAAPLSVFRRYEQSQNSAILSLHRRAATATATTGRAGGNNRLNVFVFLPGSDGVATTVGAHGSIPSARP